MARTSRMSAQWRGTFRRGSISGAHIPGASIGVTDGFSTYWTTTDNSGRFEFNLPYMGIWMVQTRVRGILRTLPVQIGRTYRDLIVVEPGGYLETRLTGFGAICAESAKTVPITQPLTPPPILEAPHPDIVPLIPLPTVTKPVEEPWAPPVTQASSDVSKAGFVPLLIAGVVAFILFK